GAGAVGAGLLAEVVDGHLPRLQVPIVDDAGHLDGFADVAAVLVGGLGDRGGFDAVVKLDETPVGAVEGRVDEVGDVVGAVLGGRREVAGAGFADADVAVGRRHVDDAGAGGQAGVFAAGEAVAGGGHDAVLVALGVR